MDVQPEEYRALLRTVYGALCEKGYRPVDQIVGYLLSGDPAYITNHHHARTLIAKIDRDELLRLLVEEYLDPSDTRAFVLSRKCP